MLRINTLNGHQRMSTQELLQLIAEAVAGGETEFYIAASGQHDIGGPLWNQDGKTLNFTVANPGQRVGSMCMPATRVTVEGSVPADAGWLNSGGIITVRGDAGDTAAHCAASGKIFIGGRAGTRTGSLMKHDPEQAAPELWVLKSVGSFSFEFMSGGKAVICGHDSQILPSVLGERPCVGMVGGVVYFRGSCALPPPDATIQPIDQEDMAWLDTGLDEFLTQIGQQNLKPVLAIWKHWRKIIPNNAQSARTLPPISTFHASNWIEGGIFGDVFPDDGTCIPLVPTGENRLSIPQWDNAAEECIDCRICLKACPQHAVLRRDRTGLSYSANDSRCTGCGICAALCPKNVWHMLSPAGR